MCHFTTFPEIVSNRLTFSLRVFFPHEHAGNEILMMLFSSHFGPSTLLSRVSRSVQLFLLQIRKTLCYAAQSLVEGRCPFWVQILRGPRPKSEQWSRVTVRPPQFPCDSQLPICEGEGQPDVLRDAARTKIQKLEKALEVMGDIVGPAVDALKAELDKARRRFPHCRFRLQRRKISSNVRRNVCWIWSKSGKPKLRCWRTRRRGWPRWRSPIKNQKPPPVPLPRLSLRQRGPRDGSFEGQFCRRKAGCGSPGHCKGRCCCFFG